MDDRIGSYYNLHTGSTELLPEKKIEQHYVVQDYMRVVSLSHGHLIEAVLDDLPSLLDSNMLENHDCDLESIASSGVHILFSFHFSSFCKLFESDCNI